MVRKKGQLAVKTGYLEEQLIRNATREGGLGMEPMACGHLHSSSKLH